MPLTPSGKLDRKALPEPELRARAFRAPVTPAERAVATVFAEVLAAEQVGLDDDFFALGGNWLLATQISARLAAVLDADVPVRALFEHPTVAGLSAHLRRGAAEPRKPLVALERGKTPDRIPLSYAQRRMWFLNHFDSNSVADNLVAAIRLTGPLDHPALNAAITDVITRHETLRTVYPAVDGIGHQTVLPPTDLTHDLTPETIHPDAVAARIRDVAAQPFTVTDQVPLRLTLLRVVPADRAASVAAEHVLVFAVHHIAADGWSIAPLTRDLMTAYAARCAGGAPEWEPLPVQYADYTLWQREVLGDVEDSESLLARQIRFWREGLAGMAPELALPAERPRPGTVSGRGARFEFTLDGELRRRLRVIAEDCQASLFMVMHAAFAALLSKVSGQSDIAIGTPVAGRGEQALDGLVGMFVNTLALRTEVVAAQSFRELVASVRNTDLRAFAHADVPFERLVEALNPVRSPGLHPLFQVVLDFQNTAQPALELAGLEVARLDIDTRTAKFDLQLTVWDEPGRTGDVDAVFTDATDLFDERTIAALARRLDLILDAVTTDPEQPIGDIELLVADEREQVLSSWNDTAFDLVHVLPEGAPATLGSLFEAQASTSPNTPAITFEGTTLSYAEFSARVNKLARYLIAQGVGPDSLVALGMRRSLDLVIGMYAVITAGGAYVPLDPDHPEERNRYVLDIAKPQCVLTSARYGFGRERDGMTGAGAGAVLRIDALDLSAYSEAPVTDAERVAPPCGSRTPRT
nr:condensation domain-containing protein [Nocardia crassostreae]